MKVKLNEKIRVFFTAVFLNLHRNSSLTELSTYYIWNEFIAGRSSEKIGVLKTTTKSHNIPDNIQAYSNAETKH